MIDPSGFGLPVYVRARGDKRRLPPPKRDPGLALGLIAWLLVAIAVVLSKWVSPNFAF